MGQVRVSQVRRVDERQHGVAEQERVPPVVEAPHHFVEVCGKVTGGKLMVGTNDVALHERPRGLDRLRVDVAPRRLPATARLFLLLAGLLAVRALGAACGDDDDDAPSGGTPEEQAAAALNRGLQAHVNGDLEGATRAYREVLVHDPSNKFAFYNLGLIDQQAGRTDAARANYQLAIQSDQNYAPALFNLGIIESDADATQAAIDLYRRATVADPTFAAAFLNLGLLLRQTGDDAGAQTALAEAVRLDPSLAGRVPPTPTN